MSNYAGNAEIRVAMEPKSIIKGRSDLHKAGPTSAVDFIVLFTISNDCDEGAHYWALYCLIWVWSRLVESVDCIRVSASFEKLSLVGRTMGHAKFCNLIYQSSKKIHATNVWSIRRLTISNCSTRHLNIWNPLDLASRSKSQHCA